MATGLGLMYNSIEDIPKTYSNNTYSYAVYVEKETIKTPYFLSFGDSDNFNFTTYKSKEEAIQAFNDNKLTGYVIAGDTFEIHSSSKPDLLQFYLHSLEDSFTLNELNIYPINDTIERTEITNGKKQKSVSGIDHVIIGMSLLAPFIAAGRPIRD
ncbi:hypothetical protein AZF37_00285 [endosymbiont 'TC1' of Trimyema compressum]|uniref:hypothetical protein n=1 Tax=endosymbiont 'TC1' of Trimyema compressum TaxID=243899 RepID=UPI0007F07F4B|nr:hypothetical protein [endosymbiont 'TC1' of Trimyema compressum]AMP19820.1 hypothetical protein AZF37_00285 [endosymbiont 'TC1' of Trimyema compressum]